jgi:hypothetical protein
MGRRAFITSFFQRAAAVDDYTERLIDHLQAMDKLARAHFGCGPDDVTTETCKPHKAHHDFKALDRAFKTAKRFFQF